MKCEVTEKLQFDHVDASTKQFEISAGIRDGYSRTRIAAELAKCQLLCGPHHREKSRINGEHAGGHNKIADPQHGSAAMYGQKCRCPECRFWKKEYRAGRMDSLGNVLEV